MMKSVGFILVLFMLLSGCNRNQKRNSIDYTNLLESDIICSSNPLVTRVVWGNQYKRYLRKIDHPRIAYRENCSEESIILSNENRTPAGIMEGNTLKLDLEVVYGNFFLETDDRPGLKMAAIGEKGKNATIPAPLIRVVEGDIIEASITNNLPDSTISVFGFQERPSITIDSLFLKPGETKKVTFSAGKEGTYLYWIKQGVGIKGGRNGDGEEEQLSGAFIVDPKGTVPDDRVLVINIFSTMRDREDRSKGHFESLTINGKSWPFTELYKFNVGDTVRWRIVNSSNRSHPMHLHGFFFNVQSKGSMLEDEIYDEDQIRTIVTEGMAGRTTNLIEWIPSRPGRWIYHCHLSFHVSPMIRLPGASDLDPEGSHVHMSGLAIGIDVSPGSTDLIEKEEPAYVTMYADEYENSRHHKGFSFEQYENTNQLERSSPGPLIILKQYQPTYLKLVNNMSVSTSVHWHGLELDSWSDGVPEWSASDGKKSPTVYPDKSFTYKLSAMRPGTFMYHSHLDDVNQITQGLYGPIIVLGEDEEYNPEIDHIYIVGWNSNVSGEEDFGFGKFIELNGQFSQPDVLIKTGEKHRLRLINMSPAGKIKIYMKREDESVQLLYIAKDGADLPPSQKSLVEESSFYGAGEAADFQFEPTEPGIYELHVFSKIFRESWVQKWIVEE